MLTKEHFWRIIGMVSPEGESRYMIGIFTIDLQIKNVDRKAILL